MLYYVQDNAQIRGVGKGEWEGFDAPPPQKKKRGGGVPINFVEENYNDKIINATM